MAGLRMAGQSARKGRPGGKLCQAVQASIAEKASRLGRPGRQVRPGNPGKHGRQCKHAMQKGKACNVGR